MVWLALALAQTSAAALGAPLSPPRISLQGSVTRAIDALPGAAGREPTYHVHLLVRNLGAAPLVFDLAEGAWLTGAGKGLHARTTQKGSVWRVEEGGLAELEFDSDGYTGKLLHDANGGPLYFRLALFRQGKLIGAPYRALLPPLQTLPDYAASKAAELGGGTISVIYLRFIAGRPVPARQPKASPQKSAIRTPRQDRGQRRV